MRSIFLLLALVVLVGIALVATGLVNIHQLRPATVPTIERANGSIKAVGGQTPKFDVQTGSVGIGRSTTNVTVPVPALRINRPADAPPANAAAPAPAK